MQLFGAITYNRSSVTAAWSEWRAAPDGSKNEQLQIANFVNDAALSKDIDFGVDYRTLSEPKKIKLAKACLHEALAFLKGPGEEYAHITISGNGPFKWAQSGQKSFDAISSFADTPFAGMNIREMVAEGMKAKGKKTGTLKTSLITDVTAMGVAVYWKDWCENPNLISISDDNSAVTAIIVGKGIGATTVQRLGEAVGQFYHTEAGHIRVQLHSDDPLKEVPPCDICKMDCLTARANYKAVELRAMSYGVDLGATIASRGHKIWDIEAYYLAQFCLAAILMHAPSRIVIGGSLIDKAPFLLGLVRKELDNFLTDGLRHPGIGNMNTFLQQVSRDDAMIAGALLHSRRPHPGGLRAAT